MQRYTLFFYLQINFKKFSDFFLECLSVDAHELVILASEAYLFGIIHGMPAVAAGDALHQRPVVVAWVDDQ